MKIKYSSMSKLLKLKIMTNSLPLFCIYSLKMRYAWNEIVDRMECDRLFDYYEVLKIFLQI